MKKLLLFAIGSYIIFMLGCASEKSDFAKAEKENSIQAYEAFLQKYPQGEHKAEATKRIHELAFQLATQKDSLHVYKEFLKRYPESDFLTEVNERIEDLTYQMVKQKDSLQSYQDFLKEYPTSKYMSETKQRINQLILESTRIDGRVFGPAAKPYREALVFLKRANLEIEKKIASLSASHSDDAIRGTQKLLLMGDATNSKNVVAETRSNEQGFYSFAKVKPGTYYLLARIDNPVTNEGCIKNGWIIAGASMTSRNPTTKEITSSLSFLAAKGKSFKVKAGDQLQMNINFACK